MPRRSKGPRLYLRKRAGRGPVWVILDSGRPETSTGCSEGDFEQAQGALATYITEKYEPPKTQGKLRKTLIADVVNVYLKERAPKTADGGEWVSYMLAPILDWWGSKTLADIRAKSCDDFVSYRLAQGVQSGTARHELSMFGSAIAYYHASYGPLDAVPVLTLPPKPPRRQDYWLTRKQVADRIRAARRLHRCQHVIRALLIGVYSGTRPGAVLRLKWLPSTTGGWFDLESHTLHRRGQGAAETKKRQPPVRIHNRLLPHLRRWHKVDSAASIVTVCHYFGREVSSIDSSWEAIAKAAGHGKDGPHIWRHTAATWQMQGGTDLYEAAGYLGMSPETLWEVYGHHSPAFQDRASKATGRRAQTTPKADANAMGTNLVSIRSIKRE